MPKKRGSQSILPGLQAIGGQQGVKLGKFGKFGKFGKSGVPNFPSSHLSPGGYGLQANRGVLAVKRRYDGVKGNKAAQVACK
jgi:hypothetical protein